MSEAIIAYLGGGSADWAVKLMRDLAGEPGLTGSLRLYDIDRPAAETNLELGRRVFRHPDARTTFEVSLADTPAEALDRANIVVLSIEPGPTACRYADLEIPARHGILQTVGDTVGPGGLLRGWRAVPTFIQYAREIAAHAPDAWVINYTNPMTLCTAALYHGFPGIKAVGCCHEVIGTRESLSEFLSSRIDGERIPAESITIEVAGINHFTLASDIHAGEIDVVALLRDFAAQPESMADLTQNALTRIENEKWFDSDNRIALEFLRTFGAYGAAGDRHLAEFVPFFLRSEAELHRYGVVLTPYSWRLRRFTERKDRDPIKEAESLEPSGEEGVQMIRALLGGSPLRTNVNLPNRGQIPWLPTGHPVETYGEVTTDSIVPETPVPLPGPVREMQRHAATVQDLTLKACLSRDEEALLQALMLDPLVRLPVDEARLMLGEMLESMEKTIRDDPIHRSLSNTLAAHP